MSTVLACDRCGKAPIPDRPTGDRSEKFVAEIDLNEAKDRRGGRIAIELFRDYCGDCLRAVAQPAWVAMHEWLGNA